MEQEQKSDNFIQQLDFEQSYLNQTKKTQQGGDLFKNDNVGKNVKIMIKR